MDEYKALRIAEIQRRNRDTKQPIDYAAILHGRKIAPSLFADLPNDAECKRELSKTN